MSEASWGRRAGATSVAGAARVSFPALPPVVYSVTLTCVHVVLVRAAPPCVDSLVRSGALLPCPSNILELADSFRHASTTKLPLHCTFAKNRHPGRPVSRPAAPAVLPPRADKRAPWPPPSNHHSNSPYPGPYLANARLVARRCCTTQPSVSLIWQHSVHKERYGLAMPYVSPGGPLLPTTAYSHRLPTHRRA
jgi:hypothetical protein